MYILEGFKESTLKPLITQSCHTRHGGQRRPQRRSRYGGTGRGRRSRHGGQGRTRADPTRRPAAAAVQPAAPHSAGRRDPPCVPHASPVRSGPAALGTPRAAPRPG